MWLERTCPGCSFSRKLPAPVLTLSLLSSLIIFVCYTWKLISGSYWYLHWCSQENSRNFKPRIIIITRLLHRMVQIYMDFPKPCVVYKILKLFQAWKFSFSNSMTFPGFFNPYNTEWYIYPSISIYQFNHERIVWKQNKNINKTSVHVIVNKSLNVGRYDIILFSIQIILKMTPKPKP